MKYAGRINSFALKTGASVYEIVERYHHIEGITHLEFNYPEHIDWDNIKKLKDAIGDMKVNGVAMRFKKPYVNGEYTNNSEKIQRDAIEMTKKACDACREIGGEMVTIWQAYDGFDYPFQLDYERAWNGTVEAVREVCDYAPDLKISIEYKPFEPRSYAQLDSIGTTLLAINEINRPNLGITLDFCHMLMKHDGPANAIMLAARNKKLFGLHMNDGYGNMDNGLIFGTANASQCLEFVYYLNKYNYDGVVFFDTFPVREDPTEEVVANVEMFKAFDAAVKKVGMEKIDKAIKQQDGVVSQRIILELLKNI